MATSLPFATTIFSANDGLETGGASNPVATALQTPVRGYKFTVKFNSGNLANFISFKSVEGFTSVDIEALEYREGAFPSLAKRKVPGLVSYSDITLTKGVYMGNVDIYNFVHDYITGATKAPIEETTITSYHNDGTAAATWRVKNAWPIHYESTGFNADSSEILIETLTLTHEGVYRLDTPEPAL